MSRTQPGTGALLGFGCGLLTRIASLALAMAVAVAAEAAASAPDSVLGTTGAPSSHAFGTLPVLLGPVVMIAGAKLGGSLFARAGQPPVLGELMVGVILGNLGPLRSDNIDVFFRFSNHRSSRRPDPVPEAAGAALATRAHRTLFLG